MRWPRRRSREFPRRILIDGVAGIAEEAGVAEECAAFLSGEYAELLTAQGVEVPTWAVVNGLAHADLEALRASADGVLIAALDQPGGWETASQLLRRELVALVGDDADLLGSVQRAVLIPLELQLAAGLEPLAPRAIVVSTRQALRSALR